MQQKKQLQKSKVNKDKQKTPILFGVFLWQSLQKTCNLAIFCVFDMFLQKMQSATPNKAIFLIIFFDYFLQF